MPPIDTTLSDANLTLCCWKTGDAEELLDAARESVDSVGRWLPWCSAGYGKNEAQAWIAHCRRGWETQDHYAFAIRASTTGELLGSVGLSQRNRAHRSANLGYWVRSTTQRHGVMAAAARLAVTFGFDTLELIRIEIVTEVDNLASRRTAERLGAQFETIARNRLRTARGAADGAVYGLLQKDLQAT